jgi:hypothetical protein
MLYLYYGWAASLKLKLRCIWCTVTPPDRGAIESVSSAFIRRPTNLRRQQKRKIDRNNGVSL